MNIARTELGLGDVIATITKFFGVKTCAPCEERRRLMNQVRLNVPKPTVHFAPWGGIFQEKK